MWSMELSRRRIELEWVQLRSMDKRFMKKRGASLVNVKSEEFDI